MKTSLESKSGAAARSGRPAARAVRATLRIKSILVPIDFSPPSLTALHQAVGLAKQFRARLTLLHVVEPLATPDFAAAFPLAMENDRLMAAAKAQLAGVARSARIPGRMLEKVLVRSGRSFHEITEAARMRKVDLILLPTRGHTGLKHAVLGSTAERVVRHAPCPVLVVRS